MSTTKLEVKKESCTTCRQSIHKRSCGETSLIHDSSQTKLFWSYRSHDSMSEKWLLRPQASLMLCTIFEFIKLMIHTTMPGNKDPVKEVTKYVMAYRNTQHTITRENPSKLLFNPKVLLKLHRRKLTKVPYKRRK